MGSLTLLVTLGAAAPARAQQDGAAESLFLEAREHMKRGEPAAACPKFAESYRLDPSSGTLLNLALCEEALGNTATAWTQLHQFVESAATGDDRLNFARERIAELEPRLSWLRLVFDHWDAPSVVQLDGVELSDASLSQAIPINPGEHQIRVTRPTGESSETPFRVHATEKLDLRVSAPARLAQLDTSAAPILPETRVERPAPSAATLANPRQISNGERTAAYTLGAVGVAGLITSGVFGLMAVSNRNSVREQCPNHECPNQAGLDTAKLGARNETIANIAFAVGAVGLLSGGVLLWHSGRASTGVSVNSTSASLWVVGFIQ